MADTPQFLTLARNRDAPGADYVVAGRRVLFALLAALAILALGNLLGQQPRSSHSAGPLAALEVSAPTSLRGGLFYQGRFTVEARSALEDAALALEEGWLESMHINTIEPAPEAEESLEGKLLLHFGPLGEGESLVVHMQFQVNPTNVGRRSQSVEVLDGRTLLARVERTVTVYP